MRKKGKFVDLSAAGFSGFVIVLLQKVDFNGRDIAIICTPFAIALIFVVIEYLVQRFGIKSTAEHAIERNIDNQLNALDEALNDPHLSEKSKQEFQEKRADIHKARINLYGTTIKKYNGNKKSKPF